MNVHGFNEGFRMELLFKENEAYLKWTGTWILNFEMFHGTYLNGRKTVLNLSETKILIAPIDAGGPFQKTLDAERKMILETWMIGSHPTKVFGIFVPSIHNQSWNLEFLFQVFF